MDLTSPKNIKELLRQNGIRPSKTMGQNFLISKTVLKRIIDAAGLSQQDIVLEVGPGIGTLTQELTRRAKQVIAVEKDTRMIEILFETLKKCNNVQIVQEDILKIFNDQYSTFNKKPNNKLIIDYWKLNLSNYKVVANIPYYITAPLVRKFLESENRPQTMVLMIQKEVAQRICAAPPDMSLLAVSVQFYADAKIICYVSKNCFWPKPKVDSAIIKITPAELLRRRTSQQLFFKIVKAGFSHPRKQLANNLSDHFKKDKTAIVKWLIENGIKPEQRAETLSLDDWKQLTNNYRN